MHWSEQTYQKMFQSDALERLLWVAKEGAELHGFLVARFDAAECELENLVVAASHRRRGLATQLLQFLIAAACNRNIKQILLEVRESNAAARALYERLGFQEKGRRKAYYSQPPEDAILLALTLDCTCAGAPNR